MAYSCGLWRGGQMGVDFATYRVRQRAVGLQNWSCRHFQRIMEEGSCHIREKGRRRPAVDIFRTFDESAQCLNWSKIASRASGSRLRGEELSGCIPAPARRFQSEKLISAGFEDKPGFCKAYRKQKHYPGLKVLECLSCRKQYEAACYNAKRIFAIPRYRLALGTVREFRIKHPDEITTVPSLRENGVYQEYEVHRVVARGIK